MLISFTRPQVMVTIASGVPEASEPTSADAAARLFFFELSRVFDGLAS
jgi:hypothetical protein